MKLRKITFPRLEVSVLEQLVFTLAQKFFSLSKILDVLVFIKPSS